MSILKIGHRGASAYAPENTLLSFRKAIEMGCDGVECDVHVCKSGEVMVIHDDTLQRTTSGGGHVSHHTLAEIKKFDAGGGETVPTLAELCEALAGKMIFIELKDKAAIAPVEKIVKHFAERSGYETLPVISFQFEWLQAIRLLNPNIIVGATPQRDGRPDAKLTEMAAQSGMWSVNPNIEHLTQQAVADAHARGLKVITWTANSMKEIERARAFGVDGIISDYPDRL